jgi:hypothetical protein
MYFDFLGCKIQVDASFITVEYTKLIRLVLIHVVFNDAMSTVAQSEIRETIV